jgi:hypothetical protein
MTWKRNAFLVTCLPLSLGPSERVFHDPGSILNSALVTPRCTAAAWPISQRDTLFRLMRHHPEADSPIWGKDFSRIDETSHLSSHPAQ